MKFKYLVLEISVYRDFESEDKSWKQQENRMS